MLIAGLMKVMTPVIFVVDKLSGGIMNTHSHNADARMELLTVHAALLGAPVLLLSRIMESVTTG